MISADRENRLEYLEKLIAIVKFQEMRTAEKLELASLIMRVNQAGSKTDGKNEV